MAEPEYPLVIDTLCKLKRIGYRLSIDCHNCLKHTVLDTDKLIERFGEDHGCMDRDLRRYFFCADCRAAGRNDKNYVLITHPNHPGMGGAHNHTNAYRKAKGS